MGAENAMETAATVDFELAVEHQLLEINPGFEMMTNFKGGCTGEKVEITDRFGNVRARKMEGRLGKITHSNPDIERRWIHKQNSTSIHIPIDMDDQLATKVPLDSPLAVSVARAIKVARQDEFLLGYYASAYTGKEGTTAVSFEAANVLAADWNGATNDGTFRGLTLAKMRWVRKQFRKLMVDPQAEKIHWGITAEEIEDLLTINEYISRDYNPDSQVANRSTTLNANAQQALQDGNPTDFMGIHWVPMEFTNAEAYPLANAADGGSPVTTNGSGHRRCPVWVPSGMAGREWKAIETKRVERGDLDGHPVQYSAYTNVRYNRIHEKKCMIVECGNA
jgi:hypothetical protein